MNVTAQFSEGLKKQLDGMAIGEEFIVTARARIVGAEEALIDITQYGDTDPSFVTGQLEVKLLLSRAQVDRP